MAFTNPGKIVRIRTRPGGHGSVYEANAWAQARTPGFLSGRGIVRNTVADMNVLVGGSADNPDVVIASLPSGYNIALDLVGQQVVRLTAPATNKRIASIIAYSDNLALNSTDTTTTGSPSSCGMLVVYGATSTNPTPPTDTQIRQAVTQDGATGSQAVVAVIANITIESATTTITDDMIHINRSFVTEAALAFSATTSGWTNLSKTASEKVKFDTIEYDTAYMFDPEKYQATVPVSGLYEIKARCGIASAGFAKGTTALLFVYVNGVQVKESERTEGTGNDAHQPKPDLAFLRKLEKGDVVDVWARCTDQRNFGGGAAVSEFQMRLVGTAP